MKNTIPMVMTAVVLMLALFPALSTAQSLYDQEVMESCKRDLICAKRTTIAAVGEALITSGTKKTPWTEVLADNKFNKTFSENSPPDSDIAAASKARRRYARSVAGAMLMAMKNLDEEALLNVLIEPLRSDFRRDLEKKSLKEMSEENKGRPLSYTFRCSICNRKGDKCQVLADVQVEADPIGQTRGILFDIASKGRGSGFKVVDAPPVDESSLKTFMARNPVCGEE